MSLHQLLASYSHIELTQEEIDTAILEAKMVKERKQLEAERKAEIIRNRERMQLISKGFTYEQMLDFIKYRAGVLLESRVFNKPFAFNEENRLIIELLCMYFSRDKRFEQLGDYRLDKGLCLVGVPGVGKSWLMKLFNKNPRQCFYIRDCKDISLAYQQVGVAVIEDYSVAIKPAMNDSSVFQQSQVGVCFSDLGTEDIKNNFGNKTNVMADIIFNRYKNNVYGDLTHAETNISVDQIEEFYGARIRSRFSEMFNWIVITGKDRRKV